MSEVPLYRVEPLFGSTRSLGSPIQRGVLEEIIFIELMTSDRKLKASIEGSR